MRSIALTLLIPLLALISPAFAGEVLQAPVAERPSGLQGWNVLETRVAPDCGGLPAELVPILGNVAPAGTPLEHPESSGRQCELECPVCAIGEGEPSCYDDYIDVTNGGCNSAPPVFSTIPVQVADPFQICGTSGTFLANGFETWRDTDWFEITVTQPTFITFSCVAEFRVQIAILDGNPGCPTAPVIALTFADECAEAFLFAPLSAGTYWLWVGPEDFTGVPCGAEYVATVGGYSTEPCVLDCPPGAFIEEPEPCEPNYEDYYNGGCDWEPATFLPIEPSPDMIVICGEAWTYDHNGLCRREMDWYEISVGATSEIQFCAAAEFPLRVFIIAPGPQPNPCGDPYVIDTQVGDPCVGACAEAVLDPGTYWLIVTPNVWGQIPCGASYTATLSGFTTPVESVSWGTVKSLYR